MARLRGLGLVALGALGPVLAVLDLVALLLGVTPAVLKMRVVPALARRLAGEWCEVPIPEPYQPPPPSPRPRHDGMHEVRRRLYRRPHLPRYRLRAHWISSDGASWLDLLWLMANPIVGTALGLAAVVVGQRGLRWHGLWTRALLGARQPWLAWVLDRVVLILDGAQLAAQSLAGLLLAVLQLASAGPTPSTPRRPSCAGSSGTCTTARRAGWSRWAWRCADGSVPSTASWTCAAPPVGPQH